MQRIALLSDTHNYLDPKIFKYFESCDQIWHAGDIGTIAITDELAKIKPVIAVYGNIDGQDVRKVHPLNQCFLCEKVNVLMTHIGGYPNRYSQEALEESIFTNYSSIFTALTFCYLPSSILLQLPVLACI